MATYKVVDADQLNADMTTVANAIRAKGGTTGALVWPSGYKAAVEAIQSSDTSVEDGMINGSFPSEYSNDRVTGVTTRVFVGSSILKKITLPNVRTINGGCFEGCIVLIEINAPKFTTTYSGTFRNCYRLPMIDLPLLTNVPAQMFQNNYSLKTVILRKATITTLANTDAFQNCYHFYGTVNATYNPEGLKDGYFYVPSALLTTYQTATNWSTFADRFRALEDYTVDGTTTGALDESKI